MRMNWKRIMMPLGVLLFGAMVAIACSDSESETGNTGDGDLPAENVTVRINPNKTRVLRNPLNGWVLYLAREKNETFWEERGYDHMYVPDLAKYVKSPITLLPATCVRIGRHWSPKRENMLGMTLVRYLTYH